MLVANELATDIVIAPSAWEEARCLMSADTAALVVLITAAKQQRGLVWQPGGYLRGMTRKWASGALNLRPVLFGLAGKGWGKNENRNSINDDHHLSGCERLLSSANTHLARALRNI